MNFSYATYTRKEEKESGTVVQLCCTMDGNSTLDGIMCILQVNVSASWSSSSCHVLPRNSCYGGDDVSHDDWRMTFYGTH